MTEKELIQEKRKLTAKVKNQQKLVDTLKKKFLENEGSSVVLKDKTYYSTDIFLEMKLLKRYKTEREELEN